MVVAAVQQKGGQARTTPVKPFPGVWTEEENEAVNGPY